MARSKRYLWLGIGLLLLFFATRIAGIAIFPLFIDESIHIEYGEQMLRTGSPIYQDLGRLFTIWWFIPFQPLAAAPVWVTRTAAVLLLLPGVAAFMNLGYRVASTWGVLTVGILSVCTTFLMFFGRLALADSIAMSIVAVSIAAAYRLSQQLRLRNALLVGVSLFAAYGFKSSALYFVIIPFAAILTLNPGRDSWQDRARWLAVAAGSFGSLFIAFTGTLALLGHGILLGSIRYFFTGQVSGPVDGNPFLTLPATVLAHLGSAIQTQAHYFGPVVLALLGLAVLVQIVRRQFYLPLLFLIPLLAILAQNAQNSRYFVFPVSILVLIGALVLAELLIRLPCRWQGVLVTGLIAWAVLNWTPFFWISLQDPVAIPLAANDYQEHVRSDAGCFGCRTAGEVLAAHQPTEVIGLLPNCQAFRYTNWDLLDNVTCPRINPNRSDIPAHINLMDSRREAGVYVVLEASTFVPESAPGEVIAVIEDESGRPRLTLYNLTP